MKSWSSDSLEPPGAEAPAQASTRSSCCARSGKRASSSFAPPAEGGGIRLNAELQRRFLAPPGARPVRRRRRRAPRQGEPDATRSTCSRSSKPIVEDPEVILRAQVDKLKARRSAELKAAGVEYDERMEELEKVEHPKPNAEFLYASFALFAQHHPWVSREALAQVDRARDARELPFVQRLHQGVRPRALRRALAPLPVGGLQDARQTIPELARTAEVDELIDYLGALVRGVDSSLLDEWERLRPGLRPPRRGSEGPSTDDITRERRLFTALIRNLLFSLLRALQAATTRRCSTSRTTLPPPRRLEYAPSVPLFEERPSHPARRQGPEPVQHRRYARRDGAGASRRKSSSTTRSASTPCAAASTSLAPQPSAGRCSCSSRSGAGESG